MFRVTCYSDTAAAFLECFKNTFGVLTTESSKGEPPSNNTGNEFQSRKYLDDDIVLVLAIFSV